METKICKKCNIDLPINEFYIKDKKRKNILYAPTWRWGDGTLKKYGKKFIKELDKDFNLIIRPHFHDREYIKLLKLWAKYNGYKNVYFSNPAKIIENSFQKC